MTVTIERPAAAPAITDIPNEWTVDVTEEDIQLGVPEDPAFCAIGRATRRALVLRGWMPQNGEVAVGYAGLDVYEEFPCGEEWFAGAKRRRRWQHDSSEFVERFDGGSPVEPRTVRFTAC